MVDTVTETTYVEPVEVLSLQEKSAEEICAGLYGWMRQDFRQKLGSLLLQKGLTRDEELSHLTSYQLTSSLYFFAQNTEMARSWDQRLTDVLFGEANDSVVNVLGKERRPFVERQLIGPISSLTFLDLLKNARPDLVEKVNVRTDIARVDIDVKDKVDLVLRFGDRSQRGTEIIRLVQLKSTPEADVRVVRIEPELEKSYFKSVKKEDVKEILRRADVISRESKAKVNAFAVLVPAYDSRVVRNVFGIIRQGRLGQELIDIFRKEGQETGLLPIQKHVKS